MFLYKYLYPDVKREESWHWIKTTITIHDWQRWSRYDSTSSEPSKPFQLQDSWRLAVTEKAPRLEQFRVLSELVNDDPSGSTRWFKWAFLLGLLESFWALSSEESLLLSLCFVCRAGDSLCFGIVWTKGGLVPPLAALWVRKLIPLMLRDTVSLCWKLYSFCWYGGHSRGRDTGGAELPHY